MAKTAVYFQRGEALDYENETEALIPAGTVILLRTRMGVAAGDIPAGEMGALHMVGVFDIPKKAGVALLAGDNVVFTDTDGIDKATTTVMGYAVQDAAAGDETARVKLLG